jgi:glycosyltransferase involved in cell wall biosynthesis
MKILWVKSDFLHPTTRGGQIRTLETLRRLHAKHEIHYVAFENSAQPEGLARSGEYCSRAYPIRHHVPARRSVGFLAQLGRGLWSREPVSIGRYRSADVRHLLERLMRTERFDSIVCDFLTPAVNFPDLRHAVLFQHNVECVIWDRHARLAPNPVARSYLRRQARLMREFEQSVCRSVRHVVAVSTTDAELMRRLFNVGRISTVPTGVDVESFTPRKPADRIADLVFVGSMDWLPNVDGIRFFVKEVLPLIRRSRPDCSLAIVGREPGSEIHALAKHDSHIMVTGTVDDVRPYLWGSSLSVVPLRIGGGTRLKIYEAIAARTAVVSTAVGAEGLDVTAPDQIRLAETPEDFAKECLTLLNDPGERARMAAAAWESVSRRFSWDAVSRYFEAVLEEASASQSGVSAD